MSKDKKDGAAPSNVVAMNTNCCVDKCGKKSDRMNFCPEHYMWFKEGLVNKAGQKPTDFDKKYQAFMTKKKSAA
jgi:hypothetical protein